MQTDLEIVPEAHRAKVQQALAEAFPKDDVDRLEPGPTGASGAVTYRVRRRPGATGGDHLLRIEGNLIPGRNVHQYANLQAAAAAGIAPPVRIADDTTGILVMQWVDAQPLAAHPGGPEGLLHDVGQLITRLQQIDPFPADTDWAEKVGQLLAYVQHGGIFAPGVLDDIAGAYTRIRQAWPRDPKTFVPAHNDPNASNILFDGDRLWLIDWETSSPNDPLVDLAVAANQLAPTEALRDALLTAWSPTQTPPDDTLRARLTLAQLATQLFAGCAVALITGSPDRPPIADLEAPAPDVFERQVMSGELPMGAPGTMAMFAKVVLRRLRDTIEQPAFEDTLRAAAAGTT